MYMWILYLKKREAGVSAWGVPFRGVCGSEGERVPCFQPFDQLLSRVCLFSLGLHLSEEAHFFTVLVQVADHRGASMLGAKPDLT